MKKLVSLLLAICVMLMSISLTMATDITKVELVGGEANSGESIAIPVKITGNEKGVGIISLDVTYDSKYLTYKSLDNGIYQGIVATNSNEPNLIMVRTQAIANYTGDGDLFTINFAVNETADKNIETVIGLDVSELNYLNSRYDQISVDRTATGCIVVINKADDTTTETSTQSTTTEKQTEATTKAPVTTTEKQTEATTKAPVTTTENTTEATTNAVTTENSSETTTKKVSSGSSGGGAGASSVKVSGYTSSTTTTEAATEVTTKTVKFEQTTETTTEKAVSLSDVKVTIGNKTVLIGDESYEVDAAPYIQSVSNSTLVPLRFVALAIADGDIDDADNNESIIWDSVTKTATIIFDGKTIEFTAESDTMVIDGKLQTMENGVKAEITDGRMFVPFRALGNALDVNVEWEPNTKTAVYKIK